MTKKMTKWEKRGWWVGVVLAAMVLLPFYPIKTVKVFKQLKKEQGDK